MAKKISADEEHGAKSLSAADKLLTPDEINKTISDEENASNRITRTILNEPAIILSDTTADDRPGRLRMRLFPPLMPKPTPTVEAVKCLVLCEEDR